MQDSLGGEGAAAGLWGGVETQYFYEITPEKILNAVEEYGVRCTGRCMSLHSMENRVYEVEIETQVEPLSAYDRYLIIKFYRPGRWSREQILEEHKFLKDLQEADIPAVAALEYEGRTLRELQDQKIFFALFPKVGGRSPSELNAEQLLRIGRLMARLHTVGAATPFKHRLQITPQTYGIQNMRYLIDQKVIIPELEPVFSSLVERICAIIEPLFSESRYQRVHGDAHFGNLLWRDEGVSFVDFDDTVSAPPVQDLWLFVQGRDCEAKEKMKVLLQGYEELRDFDRRTLTLIEPLRALRMIHYAAWIAHRREDPAFQRVFKDFGSQPYWLELISDLQDQLEIIQNDNIWG